MREPIQVAKFHSYKGHQDSIYTLDRIGERQFVSSGADGMVILWDLDQLGKGQLIARVETSCYALRYHQEKGLLIVSQNNEGIHLIDIDRKKEAGSLALGKTQIFDVRIDGEEAFVCTGDGRLIQLSLTDMSVIHTIRDSQKSARTIALTDELVMVGYSDRFIRAYDRRNSLRRIAEFQAHDISVFTLQADQERGWLVSGSRDAHLKAWQLGTFELKHDVIAHMYAINHIDYSPDNQHFVTCSMDSSIKVWDAATFQLKKVIDRARYAGHTSSFNKLLWMEYQDFLISCSDDRSIVVWDIKTGDQ